LEVSILFITFAVNKKITMKKILFLACVLFASTAFAQTKDSVKYSPITGYVSLGLSMTNSSDFVSSSYTGLEGGICYKNLSVGAIFGRGSLRGMWSEGDNIKQYFYEVKATGTKEFGCITGSVLFGYGGYFNTSHHFIEYGAGIGYNYKDFSFGLTCSNWDGTTYITPCVTYNIPPLKIKTKK
jgi:hypothetical protein